MSGDRTPPPSSHVNMTREEVLELVTTAVRKVNEDSGPKLIARPNKAKETELKRQITSVKRWAGAIATAVGVVATLVTWIYARGQQSEAAIYHEKEQDRQIQTNSTNIATDRAEAVKARKDQTQKTRNLGALQIEQGNDQRAILLENLDEKARKKHEKKPPALQQAEAAVRRD